MKHWMSFVALLFLLSWYSWARAGGPAAPLFASDDILEARIVAPFSTIMRKRGKPEGFDGTFQYLRSGGKPVDLNIELRTRGNFRARAETCGFAPLLLNFKKKEVEGTLFAGQDKIKLVTHCGKGRHYSDAVIREYLAYRIHNLLTEISYRVRLVSITYIDTARKNEEFTNYGILLEHRDALATRTGMTVAEVRTVPVKKLQPQFTNLTSLFHYFIGNSDFSHYAPEPDGNCCHNHTVLRGPGGDYYSVPYDFDMSGFVRAPHSAPPSRSPLKHVRQRRYQGFCDYNEHIHANVALFQARRSEIVALTSGETRQRPAETKSLFKFVDRFFAAVETPKKVAKKLLRNCKPSPHD